MTRPLDIFRSTAAISARCQGFYPNDETLMNTCVSIDTASKQAETFGLLIGLGIGILIGRFVLHSRH